MESTEFDAWLRESTPWEMWELAELLVSGMETGSLGNCAQWKPIGTVTSPDKL